MNQRIRDLWEECKTPDWSYENQTYDHELFAELIVRECVQIVEEDNGIQSLPIVIKEHFGVEE